MLKQLRSRFNISFAANPFYMYCAAFALAIFTYSWGWSDIYPGLSSGLIIFLVLSFAIFMIAGFFF